MSDQPSEYEKACREACLLCAKGNPVLYPGFGNGNPYHSVHETEYEPGEPFERCTAPTLADFAERKAKGEREALVALEDTEYRLRAAICSEEYLRSRVAELNFENAGSRTEVARLRGALEVYANADNWNCPRCHKKDSLNCFMGNWCGPVSHTDTYSHGWAIAREALAPAAATLEGGENVKA